MDPSASRETTETTFFGTVMCPTSIWFPSLMAGFEFVMAKSESIVSEPSVMISGESMAQPSAKASYMASSPTSWSFDISSWVSLIIVIQESYSIFGIDKKINSLQPPMPVAIFVSRYAGGSSIGASGVPKILSSRRSTGSVK
jgi:hypothetical protein